MTKRRRLIFRSFTDLVDPRLEPRSATSRSRTPAIRQHPRDWASHNGNAMDLPVLVSHGHLDDGATGRPVVPVVALHIGEGLPLGDGHNMQARHGMVNLGLPTFPRVVGGSMAGAYLVQSGLAPLVPSSTYRARTPS